ncbi:MAG: polysaccharide deacetylase family protein [Bacillota bacterium]|nr:polysaccharide deacetylase family protein [Bacillota bacterium]
MKLVRFQSILLGVLLSVANIFSLPVKAEGEPLNEPVNGKKVYLTFDDGPIPVITEGILDVLKEQNVKATFFVVGKEIPQREDILRRIYNEGHSIGLHTYSHKYKKVYNCDDSLINEMLKTREIVQNTLGISPTAIRFPGGSSRHLTKELLDSLHSLNMKVYDWNIDLYDGEHEVPPVSQIIKNGKNFKPGYKSLIILAHSNSNNSNTVKALPGIIKFYKELGYSFSAIETDTPEYHYKMRKSSSDDK